MPTGEPDPNEVYEWIDLFLDDLDEQFARVGADVGASDWYPPSRRLWSGDDRPACGSGSHGGSAFLYCRPETSIDINVDEAQRRLDRGGVLFLGWNIAHEYGHHLQLLQGFSAEGAVRENHANCVGGAYLTLMDAGSFEDLVEVYRGLFDEDNAMGWSLDDAIDAIARGWFHDGGMGSAVGECNSAYGGPTDSLPELGVVLSWEGVGDLDLTVVDPFGDQVGFGGSVPSGGFHTGDVVPGCDAAYGSWVEEVAWPGGGPQGYYTVLVLVPDTCDGDVPYLLEVYVDGELLNAWYGTFPYDDPIEIEIYIE